MTSAHRELLDAVRGVRSAIGNRNLQEDEALKKVVARGIYIGAFNFLEDIFRLAGQRPVLS